MRLFKSIIYTSITLATFTACSEFLDTRPNSSVPNETALQSREYFLGFLYQSYKALPSRAEFDYEAATDNALVNREVFAPSRAARGGVSASSNPLGDSWEANYASINSLNWFLERMVLDPSQPIPTPVRFDLNPEVNLQIFELSKGEAYFLRAWFQFDLLKKYGGLAADGQVYGFPISTSYLEYTDELDLPRNTYEECVQQIIADCDKAFEFLPLEYSQGSGSIPDGLTSDSGRPTGLSALALKARTLLYRASPAYNLTNDQSLWEEAAAAAAAAIQASGNEDLMPFSAYYNKNNLNDGDFSNPDLFFRGPIVLDDQNLEKENFPPRAFGGNGKFNPSQNLVDAFPMSDGYPIDQSPDYDGDQMFVNRDPRLDRFIVRDEESWAGLTMDTQQGGADAYGTDQNSTRSGYYLQKLLDPQVSLEPGKLVRTKRAVYLLTRPELYLNFAEAAIQATGNPDDARFGYSAREILAKVRNRALGEGNDQYLPTVLSQADFVDLLRNERRIETCFEDFRFWDLRRWSQGASDQSLINSPVYGIYSPDILEARQFASPYMPLPFSEMVKTENLVNNMGW